MTFAGESLALDWANPITGSITDYGDPIRYRDGTDTLAAGASFIAGFYDYWVLDNPTETVEASVVLVLAAGTSGQVRVHYGTDPDWNLDNPALATQDLGTHTVTGAGDLVLPIPAFDVANLHGYLEESIAFVEVLSGSLVLEQIKLRIWPPGGISGAWVPGSPISTTSTVARLGVNVGAFGSVVEGAGDFSMDGAYDAAVAEWTSNPKQYGDPLTTYTWSGASHFGTFITIAESGFGTNVNGDDYYTVGVESAAIWLDASRAGQPVTNIVGVTFTVHPDEVRGDPYGLTRSPSGDGPAVWEFDSWTHDIIIDGLDPPSGTPGKVAIVAGQTRPAGETVNVGGDLRWEFDTPHLPYPPASGLGVTAGQTSLTLPPVPRLAIESCSFSWFDRPANTTEQFAIRIPFALQGLVSADDYLVWDPDATPAPAEIPMRIRQRGDGLGMGAPRVRGTASRQRSTRVRGHY